MVDTFKVKQTGQAAFYGKIILKLFFIFYCVVLLFPNFTNSNEWFNTMFYGLDPSWVIGLQYAYEQNLTYGEEIIFTFGPLGYLQSPDNFFVPEINHILFGIFQLAYLLIACNLIFNKFQKGNFFIWILILASIPVINLQLEQPVIYVLFFSFLFLFQSLQTLNYKYLILAYIGALVCFYIKIDTGFPLLLATLACFVLFCIKSKQKKLNIKLIGFFIATFIASLLIFNVDIAGYLIGGFQIIKGYNVAMSTFLIEGRVIFYEILKYTYLLFILSVLFLTGTNFYKKKLNLTILLQIAILLGLSFVFYKKGMTRMSTGNLLYATRGIALVSLFFSIFIAQNKWVRYAFIFQFFIFNLVIPKNSLSKNLSHILTYNQNNINEINRKVEFKEYTPRDSILWAFSSLENQIGIDSLSNINFSDIKSDQLEFSFLRKLESDAKNNRRIHNFGRRFTKQRHLIQRIYLPNRIRKKLEGKTVDMFGSEIHYAYFNFLKYEGRPVFQSYAAYTPFLDNENAVSLNENSESPAEYLLWNCFHAIDKRHKYWQCPATIKEILEHYEYDDAIYPENVEYKILLKRRDEPKEIFFNKKYTNDTFEINEVYNLPKEPNKLLTANIEVNEKFLYKAFKMLYKNKPLIIEFYLEGGKIERHKIIPDIINNGVIINKYISSNLRYEEASFFKHNFNSLKNIESIKIVGDPLFFKSKINIEIFN